MHYGFRIVEGHDRGLAEWMDEKGYADVDDFRGRAVPNVTDWQYLNLDYVAKADRPGSLHPVRPLLHRLRGHLAPGDRQLHGRNFEVKDDECVACNLCVWSARWRTASPW